MAYDVTESKNMGLTICTYWQCSGCDVNIALCPLFLFAFGLPILSPSHVQAWSTVPWGRCQGKWQTLGLAPYSNQQRSGYVAPAWNYCTPIHNSSCLMCADRWHIQKMLIRSSVHVHHPWSILLCWQHSICRSQQSLKSSILSALKGPALPNGTLACVSCNRTAESPQTIPSGMCTRKPPSCPL